MEPIKLQPIDTYRNIPSWMGRLYLYMGSSLVMILCVFAFGLLSMVYQIKMY